MKLTSYLSVVSLADTAFILANAAPWKAIEDPQTTLNLRTRDFQSIVNFNDTDVSLPENRRLSLETNWGVLGIDLNSALGCLAAAEELVMGHTQTELVNNQLAPEAEVFPQQRHGNADISAHMHAPTYPDGVCWSDVLAILNALERAYRSRSPTVGVVARGYFQGQVFIHVFILKLEESA